MMSSIFMQIKGIWKIIIYGLIWTNEQLTKIQQVNTIIHKYYTLLVLFLAVLSNKIFI